jgi:hypothetical protein
MKQIEDSISRLEHKTDLLEHAVEEDKERN